jgi:hypothetical protein
MSESNLKYKNDREAMCRNSSFAALPAILLLIAAYSGTKSSGTSAPKSQTTFDFGRKVYRSPTVLNKTPSAKRCLN